MSTGIEPQVLRATIRSWLESAMAELEKDGRDTSDAEAIDFARRRHYAELLARDGWAALSWSPQYGGRGASLAEQLIFAEEAVAADAPDPLSRLGTDIIGPAMTVLATDVQKERYLPSIRAAEEFWCQGFSEPDAGSDLASLRTRAVRGADGWVINGQKTWTSFGQYADLCLVLARTDRDAKPHEGISAFAVDLKLPGITVRPIDQITGGSDFCEVFYDDVTVPDDALIGAPGEGWKFAMTALGFERSLNFMTRQVRLSKQVSDLIKQVREHAAEVPARLKDRLTDIYIKSVELRATVDHHVDAFDHGERPGPDSSASKIFWSETFQEMADLGAEFEMLVPSISGEAGWLDTYVLSRATTIYAGTSEIQRNIVAERGLGLPR